MAFYILAGGLVALVLADWTISFSSKIRGSWAFWEDWTCFVYGPLFVLLNLALAADMWWFQTDWSPRARLDFAVGGPVLAVWIGFRWFRYSRVRLLAFVRGERGGGGPGGGEEPGAGGR
ncbi:hypothetical protein AB0M61_25180 [Streptomyces sp. NPDC051642]|uniref:hypothetical protein n=1 Tax=Streptomyces sp. NPDC051642 TaxID=3154646 RepID=UPI0034216211